MATAKAKKKATKQATTIGTRGGAGDRCDSEWCEIRNSPVHGRGLFSVKDIPKGTRVIEYVGERVTKAESDRRGLAQFERAVMTGDASVYIFTLNKRHDIDGNVPWNAARLINHSCDPNCESDIIRGRIWIIAIKDIPAGRELSYNYGFDLEYYDEHPCACGAESCVGFIVGEEHWTKLKRLVAERNKKNQSVKKR